MSICAAEAQSFSTPPLVVRGSGPHAAIAERIVREIQDPHTGARWILLSDPANPGGPGRLVVDSRSRRGSAGARDERRPAIRPGDKVVVEERTAAVEAYLDAVALEPAAIGSPLKVRLTIGNRVVRAVAVAAGRVALAP